jgi:hypothetical protein
MKDEDNLEIFPRKYDHFFSNTENWLKNCNPNEITLATPYNRYRNDPLDKLNSYKEDFVKAMFEIDRAFFKSAITYLWYRRRFGYMARSYFRNDWDRNTNFAYGIFLRHLIGMEKNLYFSTHSGMQIIKSYYDDFVDDVFDPRTESIPYPFENLTLAHMTVVVDMDERLDLLDFADREKMLYNDFCDFISNWVGCFNEKYGEKYQMQINKRGRMVQVVNLLKDGAVKGTEEYGE